MERTKGIIESAMKHREIVLLVTAILVLFGIYALFVMPRQEFPVFTVRQGLVIGVYPGASSSEVEQQLTREVEKYLFGFREVNKKKTWSISKEGLMIVFVELADQVNNADEFWSKLNHGLGLLQKTMPAGVMALHSDSDFGETSALLIALEGDHQTYRELEGSLDKLEEQLRGLDAVSKLRRYGLQKEQIAVYLDQDKLASYGISSNYVLANLFTQGLVNSAGKVQDDQVSAPIHISVTYPGEEEIAQQIIYSDPYGHVIRLKDIASIVREYPKPDSYILNNGKRCLVLSLEMQEGHNIVKFGHEIDEVLARFQKTLPAGITISRIADQPQVVQTSVASFLKEFLSAIVAVILVTMLLLPFRAACVSAASIPFTIFITLGVMYLAGMELNTVTLAALIAVLGMIVDNSVVIVDSYMDKLDHGLSPWHASIASAQGFFKAILSATLAISITFFPFLFTLKGTFHDFIQLFPWTVTLALGLSLAVAMLLIPYLQFFFIKRGFITQRSGDEKKHPPVLRVIQQTYEKGLTYAFRHPWLTIGVGVVAILGGVILMNFIPQRLMPTAERNQFAVEIYLPEGSTLHQTSLVADSLETLLKQDDRVISVTSFIGGSSPRFHVTYAPNMPSPSYAQFIVNTTSNEATENLLDKFILLYSGYFPNAYVRFKQLDYQPVAAPIEVRLSGLEADKLPDVAESVTEALRDVKGISWVRTDFKEMAPGIFVSMDPMEANRTGITRSTLAANLALNYSSVPVTTVWEGDYPLSVVLKSAPTDSSSAVHLEDTYIHSIIPGISVPLRQIASVYPDWDRAQIIHLNGIPTITVRADVDRGVNVTRLFPIVETKLKQVALPESVRIEFGGFKESDLETLPKILNGLIMSILIIFLILLIHFKKINLALLVLASASLTLPGAALGGLILGIDFGITSILGIVSVIGILVRNGIIMMDYAQELRIMKKHSAKEAAIEAGKRRMRPIFLTSAAASVGVIPMIVSKSALWAPMGAVICFGTILSMILLVFILPVVYWLLFRHADQTVPETNRSGKTIPIIAVIGTLFLLFSGAPALHAQTVLSLNECQTLALKNNTGVRNSVLELAASRQVKEAAFTKFFPTLEASGLYMKAYKPLIEMDIPGGNLPVYDGNPMNLINPTQFAYFPGFSLSFLDQGYLGMVTAMQPVFAGGRIISGNKLASLGVAVQSSKLVLSRQEALRQTEEQYWQVTALQNKMKTLISTNLFLVELRKQASDAQEAGLINRNEVMKVILKQNELEVKQLQLENGITLAIMALCQTIGLPSDSAIVPSDTLLQSVSPFLLYVDPEQALQNREEYKLLQQGIRAEELKTNLKIGEYLPVIGIGAGSYYTDLIGSDAGNSLAYATAKIPLSGWWEASHVIREQKIKEEIARNMEAEKSSLMILQIRKAWFNLEESYKELNVAQKLIEQAEENLRINRDNYDVGLINISDILEARLLLQQASNQYTDNLMQYRINQIIYQQVTGRYE